MLRLFLSFIEIKWKIYFTRVVMGYIAVDINLAELRGDKVEAALHDNLWREWDKRLDNLYVNRRNLYVR